VNWESLWNHNSQTGSAGLSAFGVDENGFSEFDYYDFGENIVGVRSMTDLQDFIAAKDKELQVLHDAVTNTPTASPPWPVNGYAAWYHDYQALLARWTPARAAALAALAAATSGGTSTWTNPLGGLWSASPNTQTGEPYYTNLVRILQPVALTTSPGDLTDLHARLNAVQAIPAYTVAQPTKGADQQVALSQALAPYDPIGDPKAAESWKRDAIFGGAILVGALMLASVVSKKV
jgi:hypothetical protein